MSNNRIPALRLALAVAGVGLNRYVASGPITYYFEQGATPYVFVTRGSGITSNTGHASLVGYLVPSN